MQGLPLPILWITLCSQPGFIPSMYLTSRLHASFPNYRICDQILSQGSRSFLWRPGLGGGSWPGSQAEEGPSGLRHEARWAMAVINVSVASSGVLEGAHGCDTGERATVAPSALAPPSDPSQATACGWVSWPFLSKDRLVCICLEGNIAESSKFSPGPLQGKPIRCPGPGGEFWPFQISPSQRNSSGSHHYIKKQWNPGRSRLLPQDRLARQKAYVCARRAAQPNWFGESVVRPCAPGMLFTRGYRAAFTGTFCAQGRLSASEKRWETAHDPQLLLLVLTWHPACTQ